MYIDFQDKTGFPYFRPVTMLITLESGINVALHLLIFGIFSWGYGLITDLKDINFTT